MIKINDDILMTLRDNLRRRDELALKLGVATYEYERQKNTYIRLIDENLKEEAQLKQGLNAIDDVDPRKNYQIDLEKGILEEI